MNLQKTNSPVLYQAYLERYPNGKYSGIAQMELINLKQSQKEQEFLKIQDKTANKTMLAYAKEERQTPEIRLRTASKKLAFDSYIDDMLEQYGFYEKYRNPLGNYANIFIGQNDKVVIDGRTGLMWQKSGSNRKKSFRTAKKYIKKLNEDDFAGYNDWRLPTIDELASLIAKNQSDELYIAPVFDQEKEKCWSCDLTEPKLKFGESGGFAVWITDFSNGTITKAVWYVGPSRYPQNTRNYAKAVRSIR